MRCYMDLVMDNGQLVRIEARSRDEDEVRETLDDARKTGDWWAPGRFDGCSAQYLGHRLDRVNMARVVGMM